MTKTQSTASFILFLFLPAILLSRTLSISVEIADTDRLRQWGLMQRKQLKENHGMLFVYDKPRILSVWMFNTLIDLSAAFIDKNGEIIEIHDLKAFPEKMDPKRPVYSLEMIDQYPPYDPIILFFRRKQVTSSKKALYVLEMQKNWFRSNKVSPGDLLIWKPGSAKAMIQLQNEEK